MMVSLSQVHCGLGEQHAGVIKSIFLKKYNWFQKELCPSSGVCCSCYSFNHLEGKSAGTYIQKHTQQTYGHFL